MQIGMQNIMLAEHASAKKNFYVKSYTFKECSDDQNQIASEWKLNWTEFYSYLPLIKVKYK